jgi:dihydroxyacetone kinase-like predicted kinase
MFLLQAGAAPLDLDRLRAGLEALGESVLVAGDSRGVKVHVHNERPDKVIALGLSMGSITRITVENLDAQSQEVREKRAADVGARDARPRGSRVEGSPHVDLGMFGADVALAGGSGGGPGAAGSSGPSGSGGSDGTGASSGSNGSGTGSAPHELASLAVVAVAAGEGLARIFNSYGVAAVVHGGQTSNPSTGELLDAVEKIDAEEVLLLPNNPNVVLAARQASEMTTRRVRVVPTRNAAEGFAALLALDPSRDATANAEVMTLAGRAVQTLQVTEAVRDASIGGRKVRKGQTIVLDPDDGLLAVNSDRNKAILAALEALEPGFELVTLYYGSSADLAEAEAVARRVGEWRSGVEVEVIHGGQPHYRYLIAAE